MLQLKENVFSYGHEGIQTADFVSKSSCGMDWTIVTAKIRMNMILERDVSATFVYSLWGSAYNDLLSF